MAERGRAPESSSGGGIFWVVLLFFLFSGASGLVYEVVWMRMLGLVFGATALAVSTVLAAFMAGLALGSYLFGRLVDRRGNPLVYYGVLELGIGIFALVLPFLLEHLHELYRPLYAGGTSGYVGLSLLRFLLCFILLLLPTTLMGGTLPVLTKLLVRGWGEMGKWVGRLYSINTMGAVVGTFGAGFFLIPYLGLSRTVLVAVVFNFAVAVGALLLSRVVALPPPAAAEPPVEETAGAPARQPAPGTRLPGGGWPVLVAFGLSGFAALVMEVVWTRLLAMILGTTVYAFTTMLTTFLVGIAVGSLVVSRFLDRVRHLVTFFGFMEAALGLTALLTLYLFGHFPEAFLTLYWKWGGDWWSVVGIKFLLAMAAMFLPTFFMGTTFPVVAKIYTRDINRVGGGVGTAYAFNTVGAILGSFAGGFLFLPWLGVEGSTAAAALIALAVALVLLGPAERSLPLSRRVMQSAVVAAAALAFLLFRPAWDVLKLTRGVYVYAPQYHSLEELRRAMALTVLLDYNEEPGGTVCVERMGGTLAMRIDGKVDASNGRDMITQVSIAHLPLAVHREPRSVLVVGLGSGVTVGSVEQYPVEEIECVEISPAVIEASRFFAADNHHCLHDSRLTMIHGDGRNHVLLTDRRYDVLISQPSNPWISGIGSLFTREFFLLARERLLPGGIMCQWFQSYQMTDRDFRATIHTFKEVFPHSLLWTSAVGDVVMLGSPEPITLSWPRIRARLARPSVSEDLARVGIKSPAAFLSMFLMDENGIADYAGRSPVLHTDDNLLLEFSASRNIFGDTSPIHVANMLEHRQPVASVLAGGETLPAEMAAELERGFRARGEAFRAHVERGGGRMAEALQRAGEAYQLAPDDPLVGETFADLHYAVGSDLLASGDLDAAISELEQAALPGNVGVTYSAFQNLGAGLFLRGDTMEALLVWREALAIDAANPDLHLNLALALEALGRIGEAFASYEETIRLDPEKTAALNGLAWLYAEHGLELDRAQELAERAVSLDPSAQNHDTLGRVYYLRGDYRRSVRTLKRAVRLDPDQAAFYYRLGLAYRENGDRERARETLLEAARRDHDGHYGELAKKELEAL